MKKFFFLLLILFLHLTMSEMNAQTGWYPQVSGTEHFLLGVSFSDADNGTAVGTFDVILRTTNGGETWVQQNSGTSNFNFFDVSFVDSNIGTVVGGGGAILRTSDGGVTWVSQSSGTDFSLFGVSFTDANTGTAVGHGGVIVRTTNGGISWVEQTGVSSTLRGVFFTDSNRGTSVGDNGKIFRTTDGGDTWFEQSSGTSDNLIGVSFVDANTGTVVGGGTFTGGKILRTTNGGDTWIQQNSGTSQILSGVSFTDSQTGTAVGANGTILRTTNGGETWVSQNSNSSSFLMAVIFVNPDVGFSVGSTGTILATMDGGIPVELITFTASVSGNSVTLNWTTASETNNLGFDVERKHTSTSLSVTEWERIGFTQGYGTATETQFYSFIDTDLTPGKYSYRLKQIDFDGTYEYSNVIEVEIGIPAQFALFQNYPNPFNPVTKIKYTIAGEMKQSQIITLKVYDILGNEVAVLINEEKSSGTYEVDFNASGLSSGVYYYQLKANDYIETKRMILLR